MHRRVEELDDVAHPAAAAAACSGPRSADDRESLVVASLSHVTVGAAGARLVLLVRGDSRRRPATIHCFR